MTSFVHSKKIYVWFIIVIVFIALSPLFSYAQNTNADASLTNLSIVNGFGNIFLGENISLIPKDKLTFLDNDSIPDLDGCMKYEYHDLDRINDDSNLDLELVGIRVYKKKIINIYLFFKKENGHDVFQAFESNYGGFSQRLTDFSYNWETYNVKLHLEYGKEDVGVAIYSCKELYQELDRNKNLQASTQ